MPSIKDLPELPKKARLFFMRALIRLGRAFGTSIGLVCLFVLFLMVVVQIKSVQNYLIDKITSYLSSELHTKISIDEVDINFFHNLDLNGFYLEDQKGDTLLYAGQLKAGFDMSWKLISGQGFDVDNIRLTNAVIKIKREAYQKENNLQFVLDYFAQPETNQPRIKKKPFDLKLKSLILDHVNILNLDAADGQNLKTKLEWLELYFDEMNLPQNKILANHLRIISPNVVLEKVEKHPYIEKEEKKVGKITLKSQVKDTAQKPFIFKLDLINIIGGQFAFHNYRFSPAHVGPKEVLDVDHIVVNDITVDMRNFRLRDDVATTQIKQISASESCGFRLEKLQSKEAIITPRRVQLNDMKLETKLKSEIGDTLVFKYGEFERDFVENFEDNVNMEGHFHDSKLALGDLMYFSTDLNDNAFFKKNKNEIFEIDGLVQGRVNNLKGTDLFVKTKGLKFEGNFRGHDLALHNQERLNLKINKLETDMGTLRLLVPSFNPPANYNKLGKINFDGNFDGFFADFSADGHLRSALGEVDVNMRLDLKDGQDKAKYSGSLDLINFDLAQWTDDQNLGKISFHSDIKDGTGLTAEKANAKLSAVIQNFTYKKYEYKNLKIDGDINKNGFKGDFGIKDDNVDFTFKGLLDFQQQLPEYNFKAKIRRIDLQKLNLTPNNDYVLSGDMDLKLKGSELSDIQGDALISRFNIRYKNKNYAFDSISVHSVVDSLYQHRELSVKSEILNLDLNGNFEYQDLPKAVQNYVVRYHPVTAQKLGLSEITSPYSASVLDFKGNVWNSKNLTQLFDEQLDTLKNIEIEGHFDSTSDSIFIEFATPRFKYDVVDLNDVYGRVDGSKGNLAVAFGIYNSIIDGTQLNTIRLTGQTNHDSLAFLISTNQVNKAIDNVNLNGNFSVMPEYFEITLDQSNLRFYDEDWKINNGNYIRFGSDFIETQNLFLTNGNRKVSLQSEGKRGLVLDMNNFKINPLNPLIDDDRFVFDGNFDVQASIEDVFKTKNIKVSASMDTLILNKTDWGTVRIDADIKDLKSPVKANVNITKGDQQLIMKGFYTLPNTYYEGTAMSYPGNYFNFDLVVNRYPLIIAKYLIGDGVSDVSGKFDGNAHLFGFPDKPSIKGDLRVYDAKLKVDYLNTTYYIKDEKVKINSSKFDATGAKLYDEYNNVAYVEGGITHTYFDNWGLNCRLKSPRILMLNTTKKENPLYYGTGIGNVNAYFTGSFDQTNIEITAITGKGTKLNIPVSNDQEATGVTFLKYKPRNQVQKDSSDRVRLNGISFDMALSMTDDAEAQIIFDEKNGDIIKGRGRGDLQISVNRSGAFSMYGDYKFSGGEYLFTIPQLLVNKPFKLKEGGTLRWTGDPFDAQINIEAEYRGLLAAPYNLLAPEDLQANASLAAEARKPTNIDLGMNMEGKLLKPEISFKVNFPNLTGNLKTYVDNRMRIVTQDQNELNRQVFGLVVIGSFLPNSGTFQDQNSYVNAAFNTLTGFVSNQLANYVNELLKEVIKENGVVSGIDIDLNYQRAQDNLQNGTAGSYLLNQVQFKPRFNLFEDKLSVDVGVVGGQSIIGTTDQAQTYLNGDFAAEYSLTADRKLKIRAYNRSVRDVTGTGNRTGVGLVWRREFDSFGNLFKKKKKK